MFAREPSTDRMQQFEPVLDGRTHTHPHTQTHDFEPRDRVTITCRGAGREREGRMTVGEGAAPARQHCSRHTQHECRTLRGA